MTKVTQYYCKNFNNPETAMLEELHVSILENSQQIQSSRDCYQGTILDLPYYPIT